MSTTSVSNTSSTDFRTLPLSEMQAIVSRFDERVSAAFQKHPESKEWVRRALRRQGAARCPVRLKRLSLDVILRYADDLADLYCQFHSLGLKFGIHILQGIPREAVRQNLPISGSPFHAQDATNPSGTCRWNFDYYDLKNNAAGQAYYDSLASMYAAWGVDFIKVDCISASPYKGDEIRMLSTALAKTGRPIVLSLSPGPTPVQKMAEVEHYATIWRISGDVWDIWQSDKAYPRGLNDQFAKTAAWASAPREGRYPDADMLPLGYLGPAPGWGEPRWTRLSHDEQESLLSLWGIEDAR